MKIEKSVSGADAPLKRIYIASAILKNFRGHQSLQIHLLRSGAGGEELEAIRDLGLVGPPDPAMPAELLAGATEEAALRCILESFTEEECDLLAEYLESRYGDQIEKLSICPLELPAPLGVGPLGDIPESASSGFINFDEARDYPLPFRFKAFYQL